MVAAWCPWGQGPADPCGLRLACTSFYVHLVVLVCYLHLRTWCDASPVTLASHAWCPHFRCWCAQSRSLVLSFVPLGPTRIRIRVVCAWLAPRPTFISRLLAWCSHLALCRASSRYPRDASWCPHFRFWCAPSGLLFLLGSTGALRPFWGWGVPGASALAALAALALVQALAPACLGCLVQWVAVCRTSSRYLALAFIAGW